MGMILGLRCNYEILNFNQDFEDFFKISEISEYPRLISRDFISEDFQKISVTSKCGSKYNLRFKLKVLFLYF